MTAKTEVAKEYARVRIRRARSRAKTRPTSTEGGDGRWTQSETTTERFRLAQELARTLLLEGARRRRMRFSRLGAEALAAGWIFEASCASLFAFAASGLAPTSLEALKAAHRRWRNLHRHPEVVECWRLYRNPVSDLVHLMRASPRPSITS